jgi:hypothetical protein
MGILLLNQGQMQWCNDGRHVGGGGGTYESLPKFGKQGGLKSLVSKFESLSLSSKKTTDVLKIKNKSTEIGVLKHRGWRGSIGLNKKEKSQESRGTESASENDPLKKTREDKRAESHEKSHDEKSIKSQNGFIIRGRKEGRKWLAGPSKKSQDKRETVSKSNGEGHTAEDMDSKLKTPASDARKESFVQMRIRMLEESKEAETPIIAEGSDGGRSEREKARSRTVTYPISSKHSKESNSRRVAASAGNQQSVSSSQSSTPKRKVLTKPPPPHLIKNQSKAGPVQGPEPDIPREHLPVHPSRAQLSSLAGRPERGPRLNGIAPAIRERMRMFEVAQDNKSTDVVVLIGVGASAALERRINGEGQEIQEKKSQVKIEKTADIEKEEQQAETKESRLKRDDIKGASSATRRYLLETKKSSIASQQDSDGKVDGRYMSAFAWRRQAKEKRNARSQSSSNATQPNGLAEPGIADAKFAARQSAHQFSTSSFRRTLSRMRSGPRSKPDLNQSVDGASDPQPYPPISRSHSDAQADIIERLGHAMEEREDIPLDIGEDAKSSKDESQARPLLVQSVPPLSEPKPLRLAEMSRLLRICRLGRSRSGEHKYRL